MLRSFFSDRFESDYRINLVWCRFLIEHEDELTDVIKKELSHLINAHHIWLARVMGNAAESNTWDILPTRYWEQLIVDNHRKTQEFLIHMDLEKHIQYHSEEGVPLDAINTIILYHILQHSTHHRARLAVETRSIGLTPPSTEMMALED